MPEKLFGSGVLISLSTLTLSTIGNMKQEKAATSHSSLSQLHLIPDQDLHVFFCQQPKLLPKGISRQDDASSLQPD